MTKKKVDEIFFQLFSEKNSDGTKHLRLRGRELSQRIGRRLDRTDMPVLAAFLKKYPEVISVDLAYNDLQDKGLKILAQELFDHENNVLHLNLLHCDVHAEGLKWLSSVKNLKLQTIRLVGNKLGAEGARFIGCLIEKCPTLEILDIGETDQTLESIESILMVVEKSQLKFLNISRIIPNSYYSKYNNSTLADDLGVLLKLNNTLDCLMVQKCEFDGHDVELLLGGLQVNKSLTVLNLSSNRIGDHGAQLLALWLRTRPTLISLRIAANEIQTPGAKALGLNLPFSRIRLLDLQNNKIGDQGLQDIFDSLKKSTPMRMLYIWGNSLGEVALAELERMLLAGILQQEYVDVKLYYVCGKRHGAFNPVNHFRHRFYSVLDYGVILPELKIKRNKIAYPDALPRALLNLQFVDRYPRVQDELGLKVRIDPEATCTLNANDKCM